MILVPSFSPVAINIFGLEIRWYALAYIMAFLLGLWLFKKLDQKNAKDKKYYDDLLTYVILGVILGGRIGYILFYNLPFFLANPVEIFMVWHGGMSFHGGLAGVIVATFLFAKKFSISKIPKLQATFSILDRMAVVAPIGLFLGRIANFINMEVMGRPTKMPWGITFEGVTTIPRHPSPLYEAALEGMALFIIMWILWHKTNLKNRAGAMSGIFAICYGIFRIICEQFRMPDIQLGFLFGTGWITMGTVLSFIMIAIGIVLIAKSKKINSLK